jgi:hypothetical protein
MIATPQVRSAAIDPWTVATRAALGTYRHRALVFVTTLAVGAMFGLPHLVIPALLGEGRVYTPFAVSGVSALTYDETSSYAAYVNYVLRHATPPYDTDVYENEDVPVPTTVAPYVVLAGAAAVLGGVDRAFIFADFVLPPLALLIIYALLFDITRRHLLALVGSLAVLLLSFGPRNLFSPLLQPFGYDASGVLQPLEFSRIIHPEISFTILIAALGLLWLTLKQGRPLLAIAAGAVGSLLFYTYVYYWPVWVTACLVLLLAVHDRRGPLLLTNVVTWVCSIPFWWTLLQAWRAPGFANVLARHTSELGHVPPAPKIVYTIVTTLIFFVCVAVYLRGRPRGGPPSVESRHRVMVFFSAIFVASVVALNMEILVGFNVESMLHFPNRLFQPFLTITAFALASRPLMKLNFSRIVLLAAGVGMLGLGAMRQLSMSYAVADAHEYTPRHRLLFGWLNDHTRLDDVVLTTAKDVNDLVPVFTQDRVFVPNGERTSASNQEIATRFLIAMKLLNHPENDIRGLLAQDVFHGEPPLGLTYTYFLFLGTDEWRLPDSQIDDMLAQYRTLDLSTELTRRRINYVYAQAGEQPIAVAGWTFDEAYSDAYGEVWRTERITP